MPIEIPKESRVYTTVYDTFKGVDYTNDPSNVFYRRSPSGKNMLPSIDGRPFKRNGWCVELTSNDFCTAASIAQQDVEQYKVAYFSLGDADWLVFFTSIGLFFYNGELMFIDEYRECSELYRPKTGVYAVGDYMHRGTASSYTYYVCDIAITEPEVFNAAHWTEISEEDMTATFPPTDATNEDIDYSKSFFFEGQGEAGYYIFVGNRLFMFDGEVLKKVKPKTPVVLAGCDPEGAGTLYEATNLLTEQRIVQYFCDGTTTVFTVPNGFETTTINGNKYATGIANVYLRSASGGWTVSTGWKLTANDGEIEFDPTPPPVTVEGEDNMRIVYTPESASISTAIKNTASKQVKVAKTVTKKINQARSGNSWVDTNTHIETEYSTVQSATFDLANPKKPLSTYVKKQLKSNGAWGDTAYLIRTFDSYGSKVTLTGGKTIFDNQAAASTKTTTTTGYKRTTTNRRVKTIVTKTVKTYNTRISYTQWKYSTSTSAMEGRNAFFAASKGLVYGNGIINQVFLTASTSEKYNTRVWYSAATDPTYFPDTNYIEVGATDARVMGLIKSGEYLGIIKEGGALDTSIYLAYPTSFEDTTTYAVKQSINGVGAISNGAFNILNEEPLFLSADGIMGIEVGETDTDRQLRSRSHYINKKLLSETGLETAVSFVHDGMYWLAVNNHCYVLDGSQKSSWANTKTNLQYECYYLENVPAKCFARYEDGLWFIDFGGNVCRFKDESDEAQYSDEYATDDVTQNAITASVSPTDGIYQKSALAGTEIKTDTLIEDLWDADVRGDLYDNGAVFQFDSDYTSIDSVGIVLYTEHSDEIYEETIDFTVTESGGHKYVNIVAGQSKIDDLPTRVGHSLLYELYGIYITYISGEPIEVNVGDIIKSPSAFYTVDEVTEETVIVQQGIPIEGVWSTIADDDGQIQYFKNLNKKGSLVSLLPSSSSGVSVYVKADEKERQLIGTTRTNETTLPFDYFMKKKIKKYKRLQIICENNNIGECFGVDQIVKSYTYGNYAKNRG